MEFAALARAQCLRCGGSITGCSLGISPAHRQCPDESGETTEGSAIPRGGWKAKEKWNDLDAEKTWHPPQLPSFTPKVWGFVPMYFYKGGGIKINLTSIFSRAGAVCSCISIALMDWRAAWKKQAAACQSFCSLHAGQGPCLEQNLNCCSKDCHALALQCSSWSRIHVWKIFYSWIIVHLNKTKSRWSFLVAGSLGKADRVPSSAVLHSRAHLGTDCEIWLFSCSLDHIILCCTDIAWEIYCPINVCLPYKGKAHAYLIFIIWISNPRDFFG